MTTRLRIGQGYDVHAFTTGDHVTLGGVNIPFAYGVLAHSDGDVLLHAVCDALLGAAGLGDIGMHFPDTDPRWKGASSDRFLAHAAELVRERGWEIANVDTTVVLERPKLKDFRDPIRESVARILGLNVDQVSVKFKTSEKVGPVGEGKSAEAQAIATLVR
jgi:2-C-methyl-D-erythritol 2,4-cyclodiphosphate synthase